VHRAAWPDPIALLALAEAAGATAADRPAAGGSTEPGSTAPGPAGEAGRGTGAGLAGTAALDAAAAAIGAVRRAKSQARLPMKAAVSQLILTAPPEQLDALAAAAPDVSAAGHVGTITLRPLAGIEAVHEVVL
jgi:valyl-tRNA synthetase